MANTVDSFIARQPIFDRYDAVFGYEILFRSGPENFFSAADPELASGQALETSLMTFGLDLLAGNAQVFINVSRRVLLGGLWQLFPPGRTVIELLETIEPDADVLEACRLIKERGYRLALDDFVYRNEFEPLVALADIIKLDFRQDAARRRETLSRVQHRGAALLAEKVETKAERVEAQALGYQYFQGYYFCRPEMRQVRTLAPSRLSFLRLLGEISTDDIGFERVETIIRQEVALTVRLLRYLNSAGFGWRYEVKTIEHAIRLLGARPLKRWASLIAVVSLAEGKPPELVITALARARLAELLAPVTGQPGHELELFLIGLLSVMDAVMDQPLSVVTASMSVSPAIEGALLRKEPPFGPVLELITAQERGDWTTVEKHALALGVELEEVQRAYKDAAGWAAEVARTA
ncbi:MAG: HDOD domain-containing protein [Gemmatimonadota bacterium]